MLFYVIQALNYFKTIQSDKAGFLATNVKRNYLVLQANWNRKPLKS